ncbi:hypothetical protein HYT32_01310 [Candidatus Roizmanbacteria bacterium]|nr:hypothetical protein [Candidatus Roizmanbacteria bacterium]
MAKSPEFIATRESVPYGQRMIIEEEKGKGAIFVAEYDKKNLEFDCFWPVKGDPSLIKEAAGEVYKEEIKWNEKREGLSGIVKDGEVWFEPMGDEYVSRAGVISSMTEEGFSERITKLATKTINEGVSLPVDLNAQLKQFVASVLPTRPAK